MESFLAVQMEDRVLLTWKSRREAILFISQEISCHGSIGGSDIDRHEKLWNKECPSVLMLIHTVTQPLA